MAKLETDVSKYEKKQFMFACVSSAENQLYCEPHEDGATINVANLITRVNLYVMNPNNRVIGYVSPENMLYIFGNETPFVKSYYYSFQLSGSTTTNGANMTFKAQTQRETNVCSGYYTDADTGENKALVNISNFNIPQITRTGERKNFPEYLRNAGAKNPSSWYTSLKADLTTPWVFPIGDALSFPTLQLPFTDGITNTYTQSAFNLTSIVKAYSEMVDFYNSLKNVCPTTRPTHSYWRLYSSVASAPEQAIPKNKNMLVYDLILSHDLEACKKYIEDGTIPSDATVTPSVAEKNADNDDGEDGAKKSKFDENEPSAPTVNSVKLSNLHNYWITQNQMQSFYSSVWETDLTDFVKGAFTGIYSNLISNVVSLKFMPTTAENLGGTGDTSPVILGFKTYDTLTVQTIGNTTAPIVNIGSYKFAKEYNSFADYAPYTDVKLYLPFVGVVPIDTNLFMGAGGGDTATLNIKAQYDIQSGLITYFLMRNKTMISSVSGRMAVEVPVSLQSGLDTFSTISSNFVGKATSFAGNIATGNPIGMVADIAQGSATAPPQTVFSSVGGDGAFYVHPKCMIMIRHPQYNRPKNYSHVVGFPAYVTKKVSDLSGFNIIKNPVIPLADGMTGAEHDMIVTAMQSGLYY